MAKMAVNAALLNKQEDMKICKNCEKKETGNEMAGNASLPNEQELMKICKNYEKNEIENDTHLIFNCNKLDFPQEKYKPENQFKRNNATIIDQMNINHFLNNNTSYELLFIAWSILS